MKVKRFFAPDMRQAIRLVREALGPDAVILSNRKVDGGIEIVAALGYDESALGQGAPQTGLPPVADATQAVPPAAPEELWRFDWLRDLGADHFSFCYEFHNPEWFARLCPGKESTVGQGAVATRICLVRTTTLLGVTLEIPDPR